MESSVAQPALPPQLIIVENKQTVLDAKALFNLAWALNYQANYHFGRSPWVTKGHVPIAHVMLLPDDVKPPVGAWNIILLDTTDQAGALGYHDDEQGTNIPYSDVFCKTALDYGDQPSAVASHEMCEMLVDPDVSNIKTVTNHATNNLTIVEVCDPCQGNDYDIGSPEGRATGVTVSDFCFPSWFGLPSTADNQMTFRNTISAPFELSPGGYISVAPVQDQNNWSQIFGQEHGTLPPWASRLPRIHGPENLAPMAPPTPA